MDSVTDGRSLGSYNTPKTLADWLAEELSHLIDFGHSVTAMDPACGDGSLLSAIHLISQGRARLIGRDIDPRALAEAGKQLPPTVTLEFGDTLLQSQSVSALEEQADLIIANPPWGATLTNDQRMSLKGRFSLAAGQFDTYDLFVEHAVRTCRPGAVCAFIIPESILLPQHERLRRLLLDQTQMLLIARLGEGIFTDVCRDAVIIIFRILPPHPSHLVRCLRLGPLRTHQASLGQLSHDSTSKYPPHYVPQRRFKSNPYAEFDMDVRTSETVIPRMSSVPKFHWDEWVHVGRGIEVGKRGLRALCLSCATYNPPPRTVKDRYCRSCYSPLQPNEIRSVVQPRYESCNQGMIPLIVGEDVQRYNTLPSRLLRAHIKGIDYKDPEIFKRRKLLVRKTGVGLRSAIDDSGAATTQTVYHIVNRSDDEYWIMDYLQGVMNSRVMLSFHLRKSGEVQWRSYPYITPKIFKSLPIPDPNASTQLYIMAREIAESSASLRYDYTIEQDLELDGQVAAMYGLNEYECDWIASVLNETADLQFFLDMRVPDESEIRPSVMQEIR